MDVYGPQFFTARMITDNVQQRRQPTTTIENIFGVQNTVINAESTTAARQDEKTFSIRNSSECAQQLSEVPNSAGSQMYRTETMNQFPMNLRFCIPSGQGHAGIKKDYEIGDEQVSVGFRWSLLKNIQ